jgi:hypothetical protein
MVLGFGVPPPPKFGGAPQHLFTALAVISLGAVWFVDVQLNDGQLSQTVARRIKRLVGK